jgi:hypothetical protein
LGTRIVLPPSVSSYGVPAAASSSTIALASVPDRLLNSGAYVGLAAHVAKKKPPIASARIPSSVTAFWPVVKEPNVAPTRRSGCGSRSPIRLASA